MVTLSSIIPALEKGDWFSALNLQDAYFHVTIHLAHRGFLRFTLAHNHYQYKVLPFSLSTALRVFSKMLAIVTAHLHREGITIFPYLDNSLLRAHRQDMAVQDTQQTISLF